MRDAAAGGVRGLAMPNIAVRAGGRQLGRYSVETRLGMITHCNSANFNDVDGIIGFGWANQNRSAAILKTLTQDSRPHWDIKRKSFSPADPHPNAYCACRTT